jgi:hypothetical protein
MKNILLQRHVACPSIPLLGGLHSTPKIVVSALEATKSMETYGIFGVVTELVWRLHPSGMLTTYSSVDKYLDLGINVVSICMV